MGRERKVCFLPGATCFSFHRRFLPGAGKRRLCPSSQGWSGRGLPAGPGSAAGNTRRPGTAGSGELPAPSSRAGAAQLVESAGWVMERGGSGVGCCGWQMVEPASWTPVLSHTHEQPKCCSAALSQPQSESPCTQHPGVSGKRDPAIPFGQHQTPLDVCPQPRRAPAPVSTQILVAETKGESRLLTGTGASGCFAAPHAFAELVSHSLTRRLLCPLEHVAAAAGTGPQRSGQTSRAS